MGSEILGYQLYVFIYLNHLILRADFLCVNFRNGKTCSVCLESRVVTDQTRRGDWTRNPSMNSVKFPFSVYICFEYMIQYYSNDNIYISWNVLKEILTLEN